jgi:hypothetical protein
MLFSYIISWALLRTANSLSIPSSQLEGFRFPANITDGFYQGYFDESGKEVCLPISIVVTITD